jgi:hypothetical protein
MLELMGSKKGLQKNFGGSKKNCSTQIYYFSDSTVLFLHVQRQVFILVKITTDNQRLTIFYPFLNAGFELCWPEIHPGSG